MKMWDRDQQLGVLLNCADLKAESCCQGGRKAEMTPEVGEAQQTLVLSPGVKIRCILNLQDIWGSLVILGKLHRGQNELENSILLSCFKPNLGNS